MPIRSIGNPIADYIDFRVNSGKDAQTNFTSNVADIGKSQGNPAESALEIMANDPSRPDGLQWIKPLGYGGAAFQVYCILQSATHNSVNDPAGWMHVATINDSSSVNTSNSGQSPWGYYIHRDGSNNYDKSDNNAGRWGDTTYFGTQSFTADFKHDLAYGNIPCTRMMIMDQGATLRRLFYTEAITQVSSTRHWFGGSNPMTTNIWLHDNQRGRNHSTSSKADAAGGIGFRNLSVTQFNANDDVFANCSRVLFGFGESDDMDASNHDRSMITPYGPSNGISETQGLGVSRQDGSSTAYRDVDPTFRDEPGSISSTYNYTLWIK